MLQCTRSVIRINRSLKLARRASGRLNSIKDGQYTLTYGEAVDLKYCRPAFFHRHEGKFTVVLKDEDDPIFVSGTSGIQIDDKKHTKKFIGAIQKSCDFYTLARSPKYKKDGKTPDLNSYQASMLREGIEKLDDRKNRLPVAGGLVIAPNIETAKYMGELLEILPLYTTCLPEFGVGQRGYEAVQTWQSKISGGVNCFSSTRSGLDNEQESKSFVSLSSKALVKNHSELSNLLYQTLTELRLDESERLTDLVEQMCARKENSITAQGHSLAMSLASSGFSPTASCTGFFAKTRFGLYSTCRADSQPREDSVEES